MEHKYPVVDDSACRRCRTCVRFCAMGVFGRCREHPPTVARPENCVACCRGCSQVCPNGAIRYETDKPQDGAA